MLKKFLIAAFAIGLLIIPCLVHGEVYRWVDEKGTVSFTDDYSTIPEKYRQQVEKRSLPEVSGPTTLDPQKKKEFLKPNGGGKTEGTTEDLSVRTEQLWATEAAAAQAGPKPTDHEALIRSWLKTILHLSTEAQVDIGEVKVSMYVEEEDGLSGRREKVWWGWNSTVTVRGAASMSCTVYMKEDRVVFALFPNGSAITADGIRLSRGARIPGLMQ